MSLGFGALVKKNREEKELSMGILADMAGVTKSSLRFTETERTKPHFSAIVKICDAFNIDVVDFLEEKSQSKKIYKYSLKKAYLSILSSMPDALQANRALNYLYRKPSELDVGLRLLESDAEIFGLSLTEFLKRGRIYEK